ncbi:Aste57867_11024 [Aphanomyces stellatus]|uniref:Aste57867_11024 protein n=1 Tax=Aphanomyces stellatus TaxID=120398 RepID=A0A485KTP9_9STRA|nr:hypothetical protein As57867_010983 [Aphanomyces stellatus]VFT87892.1 Aste57867_11024 [Aphanomyces stellatus]
MSLKRRSSNPPTRVRDFPLLVEKSKGDKDKMIVNLQVIVLDMDDLQNSSSSYASVLIADDTAAATLLLKRSLAQCLNCGDILSVENAALIFHNTHLVVSLTPTGRLERVGEFTMVFKENINVSNYVYTKDASGLMVRLIHARKRTISCVSVFVGAGPPPEAAASEIDCFVVAALMYILLPWCASSRKGVVYWLGCIRYLTWRSP